LRVGTAGAQVNGFGAPAPTLRPSAIVMGEIVRIGDLIDGAGPQAGTPIFRAPDLGQTGSVPAYQVLEAARAHGLFDLDTRGITEVEVTRATRTIPAADIEARLARTL